MSKKGLVDFLYIREIAGDNPEPHRKIYLIFIDSIEKKIPEIEVAVKNFNFNVIEMLAQQMKSSAKIVGAHNLGLLCQKIKFAAKKLDEQYIKRNSDNLFMLLNSTLCEIRNHLQE